MGWLREQILKVVHHILRQASRSLSQHVSARWVSQLSAPDIERILTENRAARFWPLGGSRVLVQGGKSVVDERTSCY